jgi:hypothetical protein
MTRKKDHSFNCWQLQENILEEYYDSLIPGSWRDHNDVKCNDVSYNHDEYSDLQNSSKKHSSDITTNHSSTDISIGCYKKWGFFNGKLVFSRISSQQEIC